jgi:hypothetical protein
VLFQPIATAEHFKISEYFQEKMAEKKKLQQKEKRNRLHSTTSALTCKQLE